MIDNLFPCDIGLLVSQDLIQTYGLDLEEVRDVILKDLLGEQPLPLGQPAGYTIGKWLRAASSPPPSTQATRTRTSWSPRSTNLMRRRSPPRTRGCDWKGTVDLEFLMVPGAPPPPPTAPYSHAVRAGDFLFVTGQLPSDPKTGDCLVPGGIVEQTHQVMRNLQTVLAGLGTSLDRTVLARVYLLNFADYAAMNGVYASYFAPGRMPGRTCIGVTGLALDALVEIDLVVRPNDEAAHP